MDVSGVRRRVDIGLLEGQDVPVGDWVLIHVGFAMSKISEAQAQEQMRMLALLGEDEAALDEFDGYSTAGQETGHEVRRRVPRPARSSRKAADEIRRLADPAGTTGSWRCAAGTPTPSTASA